MVSCAGVMTSFGSLGTSSSTSGVDYLMSDAVGVIELDGTIQYDGSTCSPEGLKEQLDIAAENGHVKAIVLRVNSGGGHGDGGRRDVRVRARVLRKHWQTRRGFKCGDERFGSIRDFVAGRLHLHREVHGHRLHRHCHAGYRFVGAIRTAGHQHRTTSRRPTARIRATVPARLPRRSAPTTRPWSIR